MNVVCYSEELKVFEIYEGLATRSDCAGQVTLSPYFTGMNVHVWIYFNNVETKQVCNSPYLGLIPLI